MEFWGVEVKSGQPLEVNLGEGKVLHLSQACLGELKKDKQTEPVCLYVTVDEKKLVLGTLHSERLPQQLFDLVFDKDFQLSHNWKNGSVYFYGYRADNPIDIDGADEYDTEEEEDEDLPLPLPIVNGKQEPKKEEKAAVVNKTSAAKGSAAGKQKVKIVEPEKEKKADSDSDDSDDSDDATSEDSDSDEDDKDSSDDEEDSDEEEETPKKQQSGKKRANEAAAVKTPSTDKKAKLATPQKTDGKKGGVHVATPHPSKQAAKTPVNKSNQKSPASESAHSCKSCNRGFKSENALQSHNQAKHTSK